MAIHPQGPPLSFVSAERARVGVVDGGDTVAEEVPRQRGLSRSRRRRPSMGKADLKLGVTKLD